MPDSAAPPTRSRWETAGIAAYLAMAVGVAGRLLVESDPNRQNVWLKVFAPAARSFVDGGVLYTEDTGFRYPPLVAALMVPFTWLGPLGSSIAWRWALLLCLGLAARACMRAGFPFVMTSRERGVFWILLTMAVIGSANIGQPNTLILACMLFATLAACRDHLGSAGLYASSSAAVKVYPLAHGLVLAVLRPRLWPWLLIGVALVVGLPFVLQKPGYVLAQYEALWDLLRHEDRTVTPGNAYRDLRSLAAALGTPMTSRTFAALQVAAGAGIAFVCWWLQRRGMPKARVLEQALCLTVCWCLLLGPATERVTYALLGPCIAWPLLESWRQGGFRSGGAWLLVNLLYLSDHLVPTMPRDYQAAHPWTRQQLAVTTLLAALLFLQRAWRDCWHAGGVGATMSPPSPPEGRHLS